jgi:hypothetical protein
MMIQKQKIIARGPLSWLIHGEFPSIESNSGTLQRSLNSIIPAIKMRKKIKYIVLSILVLIVIFIAQFIMIKRADNSVVDMKNFYVPTQNDSKPFVVPSKLINGERFYIKIPLESGDTVLGFGDTGGGNSMLMPATVEKKDLKSKVKTGLLKGIMPIDYILFKDMVGTNNFPSPYPMRNFVIRRLFRRVKDPILFIPPMDDEMKFLIEFMPEMEVFLGQNFFMGKAWTFDYPGQTITLNTPLDETKLTNPNVQKIGLKKNSNNESIFGHASMTIEINGERIDVLFDTGASLTFSDEGREDFNTNEKTIGGSFIAASIFDRWQKEHPDWKVYPKADMNNDVIEVPIVKIGNNEVGPVLFSKRPDENWSMGMIHTMDKVVKGAIGGSCLQYFKVTIDYNSELIMFEK